MGDDYSRAIDLVTSRTNVRALVSHHESLNDAPALFEALVQNLPGSVKVLLYPNEEDGGGPN
jgi:threonine dehydrogenase-like Zn-dependent dehydrogenase